MRVRVIVGTALCGACGFFACTSTDGATTATPTPDSGVAGSSDAEHEAGATDAPSDTASEAEAAATGDIGGIFAISDAVVVDGGPRGSYRAGGFFVHRTGVDTTTTSKTVGPCLVEKIGSGTSADETDLSAGVVHITGGKKTVDVAPSANKSYSVVTGSESLWTGGEMITVTAGGEDVPAFTTSLVAPSTLTMTAPALPSSNGALDVTRSATFAATWTGTSSGLVVLYFDAATSSNAFAATCTFAASAGKGDVPAAAFADFPAVAGTYNFYVKHSSTAAPAGWSIRFTASSAIVGGAGESAVGSASFK